ncbi:MAG TPA: aminotransferase class IV [Aestuariivirga sp.]|nr:aminotransferase class IV [Aestuariivirga sp.]
MIGGDLPVEPTDRGLLLGDGIFETFMVIDGTALWRKAHLARLESAALELGILFDAAKIAGTIDGLLLRAEAPAHVLRVTLTRGSATRGLVGDGEKPTLLASLNPFSKELLFQPVTLATSTIRRNESAPSSRLKTLSYIDNIAAARKAVAKGAGDALMLNTGGNAASSTISNLFLVKDDRLITPALDQAILPGIMRQVLLDAATSLGFKALERPVAPAELMAAQAVFLTNSLRFIRPVTALDGLPLRTRNLGPLIDALCDLAQQQCGRDPRLI